MKAKPKIQTKSLIHYCPRKGFQAIRVRRYESCNMSIPRSPRMERVSARNSNQLSLNKHGATYMQLYCS